MRHVLDGPVGDEILKSGESAGFIGLAFYDSGARSIYAKKPVDAVADAKGLKIRQEVVPGRDGPGVREVHGHARHEALGESGAGREVMDPPFGPGLSKPFGRLRADGRQAAAAFSLWLPGLFKGS